MDSIRTHGGIPLNGRVAIQGSKNASLPVLAASLLAEGVSYIENCPKIADVYNMIKLLEALGCRVKMTNEGLSVDSSEISAGSMPRDAITGMRSSLCFLSVMLGRCGEVFMDRPGGCVIGDRPIDIHLDVLRDMGVTFEEKEGMLYGRTDRLHGISYSLPVPSVGVTENVILAGVCAEGETRIANAAREPEIVTLCDYLRRCGADISGDGSCVIRIEGGRRLHGCNFRIPPDRIVAGTYVFGCIAAGGEVFLEDAPYEQMEAVLAMAGKLGAGCVSCPQGVYIRAQERPKLPPKLTTEPYPGFPTDLQSAALVAMLKGEGSCTIEETIFENRFRIVDQLTEMGADIRKISPRKILVKGVGELQGKELKACELRGGAALVLAGLMAKGQSFVSDCAYIYRGYENICRDLQELGARISCV